MSSTMTLQRVLTLGLAALLALAALPPLASAGEPAEPARDQAPVRWSEETAAALERLPLQHGGRVKPLRTWADYKLLAIANGRKLTVERGGEEVKLDAVDWALDCFFDPDLAATYRVVQVDDWDVLRAAGVDLDAFAGTHKKRDRWSYRELAPVRDELMRRAQRAQAKGADERTREETQTLDLALKVRALEGVMGALDPLRAGISAPEGSPLGDLAVDGRVDLITILQDLETFRSALAEAGTEGQQVARQVAAVMESAEASAFHELALVPPVGTATEEPEWLDLGDTLVAVLSGAPSGELASPALDALGAALGGAERREDSAVRAGLERFASVVEPVAAQRGELERVGSEVSFQKQQLFTKALVAFLLAFLLGALSFLPGVAWLGKGAWGAASMGAAALVGGIAWRCWINGRPPITTLYETAPFIGACGILLALGLERLQRQRVALTAGSAFAVAVLFLSFVLEKQDAAASGDSMKSLVAVLDTNFWLSTHVTTVTFGYCAGLFAWLLATVWLVALPFVSRLQAAGREVAWHSSLIRSVYGVVVFGLLFSLVGTILGGIWANYSWGRFWGWDPKENGALVIVLWQLVIVHARLGGMIRDLGLALLTVVLGSVVVFSWFGVNQLGVGLHSYGFTTGASTAITICHWTNASLVAFGLLAGRWAKGALSRAKALAPKP
jgi:ABC-type transport system involved in cytochrome c biogenesis permease subunit